MIRFPGVSNPQVSLPKQKIMPGILRPQLIKKIMGGLKPPQIKKIMFM